MQNRSKLFIVPLLLLACITQAQSNTHLEYIDRYKEIAIREMERAGIPASIKLAQGLLESGAGTSDLARRANNHFGIKCGGNWEGKTYYKKDDDYDDRGELIESCFRDYRNPESSYIAHSEFLRDPNKQYRYGFLFRLDPTDYKAWARGLKRAGYATSATYAIKLIDIIERYELHRYDRLTTTEVIAGGEEVPQLGPEDDAVVTPGVIFTNNDVDYMLAREGETLNDIALRTRTDIGDVLSYNDQQYGRDEELDAGTVVYLQPKRNSFRGRREWHYVKEGETMFSISQIYGIDLGRLYRRNKLEKGEMPAVGERVKIRGWNVSDPPRLQRQVDPPPSEEEEEADEDFTIPLPPLDDDIDPIVIKDEEEDFEMDDGFDLDNEDYLDPITPIRPPNGNTGGSTRPDQNVGNEDRPYEPPVTDDDFSDDRFDDETGTNTPETDPAPTPSKRLHTVVKGDTLYNISRRYDLTVAELKALNGLTSNTIYIGQQLKVK
ncbi:MAG: LysM peptidoglycan-binding domain-containing protein [Bacteroidetes bacterium]|jgi:LysM repeat protein|nr:LysM peptidoglycan-binding domain-containing protein [Bacteroidota bacterium]